MALGAIRQRDRVLAKKLQELNNIDINVRGDRYTSQSTEAKFLPV